SALLPLFPNKINGIAAFCSPGEDLQLDKYTLSIYIMVVKVSDRTKIVFFDAKRDGLPAFLVP
ncbi:MAG: hypothetical protein IKC82_05715, partial [Lentisphaeria bacterium]|nr:hypothetical protein [Lentisphaeria bacterium]